MHPRKAWQLLSQGGPRWYYETESPVGVGAHLDHALWRLPGVRFLVHMAPLSPPAIRTPAAYAQILIHNIVAFRANYLADQPVAIPLPGYGVRLPGRSPSKRATPYQHRAPLPPKSATVHNAARVPDRTRRAAGELVRRMARCRIDTSIDRVEMSGFSFPLGVYPIEPMEPRAGYTVTFEPADGQSADPLGTGGDGDNDESDEVGGLADGPGAGGAGIESSGDSADGREGGVGGTGGAGAEWEEWPDRYVFDILVPATRVEALCRSLFAILPGRVYPILDVLGQDEFREVDPYVSYDLVGLERFLDGLRRFSGFFYEDGLVGFGVMSEEPFLYIFIDEHKIVTVRVETALREKVEAVLNAFDLAEVDEIAGADAATHEHRGVLVAPDDRPDLLNAEEVVEFLRDEWHLVLNVDPETNLDDEGNPVGITGWRCLVRHDWDIPTADADAAKSAKKRGEPPEIGRYAEIFLTASCFREAEDLALAEFKSMIPSALRKIWEQDEDAPDVPIIVAADRLTAEHFVEEIKLARTPHAGGSTGGSPGGSNGGATAGASGSAGGAGGATPAVPEFDESRVWHAGWLPLEP